MGESPLRSLFPHLYHLSSFKNHLVLDFLSWPKNSVSFTFGFRRHLTNRDTKELASVLSLLEGCPSREGRRNVHVWSPNPSQGFSSKSLFSLLLDPSPTREFVFYVIWRIKVRTKVRFFTWQVLLGHVNIVDRLVSRRTMIVEPFYHILCRKAEEDLDHLL